jgi:hypothetical protein
MAQTPAAVQAELGLNFNNARILQARESAGSLQEWYVIGGQTEAGRARWVVTTAADDAATQAAAILTALRT